MKKLSIVIPFYNEEGNLPELVSELKAFLPSLGIDWEVVLVDDLSDDDSLSVAKRLSGDEIKTISLPERAGQSSALQAGFKASSGDWIVTMDADLENDIGDLPVLLKKSGEADMVVGVRVGRQSPFLKKAASAMFRFVCRVIFASCLRDVNSPFRLFKREVVEGVRLSGGLHRYLSIIAGLRGFKVVEVEVSHRPRRSGASKYPPLSRLWPTIRDLFSVLVGVYRK
jgi:dolichol-phosphate mannosyltransferase